MKARVTVTLKSGILDPQGKAIEGALKSLGVAGVGSVRQGKVFDIELEGTDGNAYEPQQYRVLTDLMLTLCDAYPSLSTERIVGHSDIAPGRKSDPGPAFDWPRLNALLAVRRLYG